MDKLNEYVKAGIFTDKNNDGFTKAERKSLGDEFSKLHSERGDLIDFKKMKNGQFFDYKNEEFVRLANAAGYILKEEPQKEVQENSEAISAKEVQTPAADSSTVMSEAAKVEQNKNSATLPETKSQNDEIGSLHSELEKMKTSWTEDELKNPSEKLGKMTLAVKSDIDKLKQSYTTKYVTKKRFLRKPIQEKVQTPKTEEQLAADKIKLKEKNTELDKLAKLQAVETLYSSNNPIKFAPGKDDKMLTRIVTTKDGEKLGVATVRKEVYNSKYNCNETTWVDEYYPVSLEKHPPVNEDDMPAYYYRVEKTADPVNGKITLANGKVVQE